MAHELDPPIPPDLLNPAPHAPLAGDWHDDDAQAYGQDFASAVEGPQERAGIPHAKNELKPTTRILGTRVFVGTQNGTVVDPVMLLPPDPNRKNLTIQIQGAAGDYAVLASSKTGCYNGPNVITNVPAPVIVMDGHTGALWCYANTVNSITVTVVAVTV